MNAINKKLYVLIFVCLLALVFTVGALAENAGSTPTTTSSSSANTEPTSSNLQSGDGNTSDTGSELTSDLQSGDTGSDLTSDSSNVSDASDLTSSDASGITDSSAENESDVSSQKKPTYHGNIGGTVSDGIDTSGWGTDNEEDEDIVTSPTQSAGTTQKGGKQITDYSTLLWWLMIIPIALMIGSIAALVYVNRKQFVEGASTGDKKPTPTKKKKNNHNNRTNVYRPRD